MLGTLFGSLLQYALAQSFAPRIERSLKTRPSLRAMQHAVLSEGLRLQLLIRLTPINQAAVSYVLGAAGIRLTPFVLALAGMLPSIVFEVCAGYLGRHAARIAAEGSNNAVATTDVVSYAGLALGLVGLVFASRAAHRAVRRAMANDGALPD